MSALLDEAASTRSGQPLELLPVQAPSALPARWTVSDAALRFLWTSRDRGLQNGRRRRSPEAAELRDAGLLNGFGAPTPDALAVLTLIGAPSSTLAATTTGGGTTARWTCRFGAGRALVDEQDGGTDALHGLTPCSVGTALGRLLDRLRIDPAWTFGDGGAVALPSGLLEARCAAVDVPAPADAGWSLARAWRSGTWHRVRVADQDRRGVDAVRTSTGWWSVQRRDDGLLALEPLPSAALTARLVELAPTW